MAIYYEQGDLFQSKAEAIVNTVNCVGVMGKGVALEFKNRWPENFKEYRKLCKSKELRPGQVFIFELYDLFGNQGSAQKYLVNFPTKDHWRSKSKISYIEKGLEDFLLKLKKLKISSVALPPLGCGNGGLNWADVKSLLEEKFSRVPEIDFYIYSPREAGAIPEHDSIPTSDMTRERAILVKVLGELEPYFGGYLTRLSLQKIVYFLQVMGLDYGMKFSRNTHGPYSEGLHKAFKTMDQKGFITNYLTNDPRIQASAGALAMADDFLGTHTGNKDTNKIHKLSLLIQGYESPYGMELLSSIHYLADRESLTDIEQVVLGINNWNKRKSDQFEDNAIRLAYERLKNDRLIN